MGNCATVVSTSELWLTFYCRIKILNRARVITLHNVNLSYFSIGCGSSVTQFDRALEVCDGSNHLSFIRIHYSSIEIRRGKLRIMADSLCIVINATLGVSESIATVCTAMI